MRVSLKSNKEVEINIQKCLIDNAFLYSTYLKHQDEFKYQLHFAEEVARRSKGIINANTLRHRLRKQQEVVRVLELEQENKRLKISLHKERSCHLKDMQMLLNEVKELRILIKKGDKIAELTK